ncbi:MAG: Fic family protein [Cyanobacteria bacterium P01_A01_bin.105]
MAHPVPSGSTTDASVELHDALLAWLIAHPRGRLDAILTQMLKVDTAPQETHNTMDLETQQQQVTQLKTWLDSFRPLSPAVVAELKQRYDVRFTYHSNAIEGNTLTQSETELVLSRGITVGGKTLAEHLEAVGHKEAIDYIEALAQADTPIGEWEIRQIHNLVIRKLSPSEADQYRQLDVKAAGTDHTYPPHYQIPQLMTEFAQWLNDTQQPPLDYATEAHYRFVTIHPFRDGNGRTGRLLMNLLLLKAGYPTVVILNPQRQTYINALVQAQQSQHDLTALKQLVLSCAQDSLIETLSVVASAADSRARGLPFYQAVVSFLENTEETP